MPELDDSLHPEYRTFLRLLRLLAYYAPEHYYHLPSSYLFEDSDEIWVREHIQDLHLISPDDYLENIYTRRKLEDNLNREFLHNPDLIYVIGPLGSGKTSLALRLRKDLHSAALHTYYLAYIDVRHALSGRDQFELAGHDLREFLRQLVIDAYLADLFPYKRSSGTERNPNLELWAYLLDRAAQPEEEGRGISQGLAQLQNHAALLFDGYYSPKLEQGETPTYYDWLEHQAPQDSEIREIIEALNVKLDIKQLASAARNVNNIYRQVIWFDNVDALEYSQQDAIHEHLRSFQTNVAALASIVIALRDENLRYFDLREMRHEHGAPPYGRRFVIEMDIGEQHLSFPGHVLPPPSPETVRTAIRKWFEATRRLQSKKLKALHDLKSQKEADLAGELDPDRKKSLRQQLGEINAEISHFGPPISSIHYDHLAALSAHTAEVLIREKASHLSNNSLRDLFRIHRDFLANLLLRGTEGGDHRPVALEYKSWYLATVFLAWIRSTERPFKLTLEDIFEHYQRWSEPGARLIGCSLPYLIINTLWNLEIEKTRSAGRRAFPTLGELCSKLRLLGYEETEVLAQLSVQIERSIVQFRFPEQLFDLGDETQLYATYCGKGLTASTFNSFGYLFECLEKAKASALGTDNAAPMALRKDKVSLLKSETGAQHQHLETGDAISQLIPYLEGVKRMHVTELVRIRDAGGLGTIGWLARYRDIFGIPNDPQFRREELGGVSSGHRKLLQFEAMLRSLISYVRSFPEKKRELSKLLADYARTLHNLERFLE